MMVDTKDALRKEKGRGLVRALHIGELEAAGAAREAGLQLAEKELDRIARALPAALDAGMSMAEIARITGVSRQTLYEIRGRYNDRDLALVVFQMIANNGRARADDIAKRVGRPAQEIRGVLSELFDRKLIDEDFNDDSDDPAMEYMLSPAGFVALEEWHFDNAGAADAE